MKDHRVEYLSRETGKWCIAGWQGSSYEAAYKWALELWMSGTAVTTEVIEEA